jgi:hypothetical protein
MPTTGSGTGTQSTAATAVTAQNLIDLTQAALDDAGAAEFSEAELLGWLNEGIREYSNHFPRISQTDLTAVAQDRDYNLPYDARTILTVEYPAGEDPPSYLTRRPYDDRKWSHAEHYDFFHHRNLTTYPRLFLSFDPTADETIRVTYQHPHDHRLTVSDNLTVPDYHHHIIIQYIQFAAARFQMNQEQANPTSSSSLLMAQLASNMRRLELSYLNSINRALLDRNGRSHTATWTMDDYDRVY